MLFKFMFEDTNHSLVMYEKEILTHITTEKLLAKKCYYTALLLMLLTHPLTDVENTVNKNKTYVMVPYKLWSQLDDIDRLQLDLPLRV